MLLSFSPPCRLSFMITLFQTLKYWSNPIQTVSDGVL